MNVNSQNAAIEDPDDTRPILIIPYMWIGDFVRGHSVVRVLKQRWPNRPVDLLTTSLCAPLVDYMPGVRSAVIEDLPRGPVALGRGGAAPLYRQERCIGPAGRGAAAAGMAGPAACGSPRGNRPLATNQ